MNVWSRLKLLFSIRASSALDQAEDPRQVLDYAFNEHQVLLTRLRQGLIEVATAKEQLVRQSRDLEERIPKLAEQARRALAAGREDLARVALERRQSAHEELDGLAAQVAEVDAEERRLGSQERELTLRVDEFRLHRDVVSARYSAAAAEVRVKEAFVGVSGDLAELGLAVGRAEEKTRRLQARAHAIDSLLDLGALDAAGTEYVERELRRATRTAEVDRQLAELKAELDATENTAANQGGK
jgi:phage shock protein A